MEKSRHYSFSNQWACSYERFKYCSGEHNTSVHAELFGSRDPLAVKWENIWHKSEE